MLACDERRIQLAQQRPEFGRRYQKHAALDHRALDLGIGQALGEQLSSHFIKALTNSAH
jgi:hypothetical protein